METKRWNYNKVRLMTKTIKIDKSTNVKNLKFLTVVMLSFNKNYKKEKCKEKGKSNLLILHTVQIKKDH